MVNNGQKPFQFFILHKGRLYADSELARNKNGKLITHYKEPIANDGQPHGNSRGWGDVSLEVQREVVTRLINRAIERGYSDEDISIMLAIVQRESGFNPDAAAGTTSASGLGQFIEKTGQGFGLKPKTIFDIDANIGAIFRIYDKEIALAANIAKTSPEYSAFPRTAQIYALHHEGLNAGANQLVTFLSDQKIDPTTGGPVYFNGPYRSGDALVAYAQNARMVLGRIEQEDNYVADALDQANVYPPSTNLTEVMQVEYDKAKALLPRQTATYNNQQNAESDPNAFWGGDIATNNGIAPAPDLTPIVRSISNTA